MRKRLAYKHIKTEPAEIHYHGTVNIGTQYVNSQIEAVYQYERSSVRDPFVATVPVKFSPLQKESLQVIAAENDMEVSELVRHATDRLVSAIKESLQEKR